MNFFKWIFRSSGPTGDYAGWQNSEPMAPVTTNSKVFSSEKAVQIPVVWACVDLLSRTVASLPIEVFKDLNGERQLDTKCNLHSILNVSPNFMMTPYELMQTMVMHWCLRGNAYAQIVRNGDGSVKALYPLNPDQMNVYMDESGKITYRYYDKKNHYVDYKTEDVLHWKCMGNGIKGLSKLEFMSSSLTENAAAQESANDVFTSKGRLKGILSTPNLLNPKQKDEIEVQFKNMAQGGIPVLPASMTFQQLSLSPAETQLLETRKFSVEEICRWFGVPSALVNSDGGAPGSNLEQVTANFYKGTILPMCISLEQAIMKRVPSTAEKYDHSIRFKLSFLNRASDKDRSSINAQAVQNGWKTRNEVRREEGLPPVKDGDALTAQNNLQPLAMLGSANASQTPQTPLSTREQRQ